MSKKISAITFTFMIFFNLQVLSNPDPRDGNVRITADYAGSRGQNFTSALSGYHRGLHETQSSYCASHVGVQQEPSDATAAYHRGVFKVGKSSWLIF